MRTTLIITAILIALAHAGATQLSSSFSETDMVKNIQVRNIK